MDELLHALEVAIETGEIRPATAFLLLQRLRSQRPEGRNAERNRLLVAAAEACGDAFTTWAKLKRLQEELRSPSNTEVGRIVRDALKVGKRPGFRQLQRILAK